MAPLMSAMRTPGWSTMAKRAEVGRFVFNPDYLNYDYGAYDTLIASGSTYGLGVTTTVVADMNSTGINPSGGVAPLFVSLNPGTGELNVTGDHNDAYGEGLVQYSSNNYDKFTINLASNSLAPNGNVLENHSPSSLGGVDYNYGGARAYNAYWLHDLNSQYYGRDVYWPSYTGARIYHSRSNSSKNFGEPGIQLTPIASKSVGSNDVGYIYGLWFSPDGKKMYTCGATDWSTSTAWSVKGIAQYFLSTAWDITTAGGVAYKTTTPNVGNSDNWETYRGIWLNEDGTALYLLKFGGYALTSMWANIEGYELTIPWYLSSRVYKGSYNAGLVSHNASSGSSQEYRFSGGNYDYVKGKYFYSSRQANSDTYDYQYTGIRNHKLLTPASEFVYAGKSNSGADPERVSLTPDYDASNTWPTGLVRDCWPTLKPGNDLEKFWLHSDSRNTNTTYEYSLSTPGTISTASYSSVSFDRSFSTSGLADEYRSYANGTSPMRFSQDGTKFLQLYFPQNNIGGPGTYSRYVGYATLSTAWDISSTTFSNYYNISGDVTASSRVAFGTFTISPDGDKFWATEYDNTTSPYSQTLHEWTMSTPWDLSTTSYNGTSDLRSGTPYNTTDYPDFSINSFLWQPDGYKFWIQANYYNSNSNYLRHYAIVLEFSCSTAWDPSTRTYVKIYTPLDSHAKRSDSPIDSVNSGNYMLGWNDSGNKLYVWAPNRNSIQEWTLEAP